MPRSFDLSANYQGSVAQVHAAFADEQYWLARLADSGADDATLPQDVLKALVKHPLTDKGLDQFLADWGKTGQSIL